MRSRLANASLQLVGGALLVACVMVPVAFSRAAVEPFIAIKATIWWLAALAAAVGLVASAVLERRSPLPLLPLWAPIALLVAWTGFAATRSLAPATSWFGQYGSYDGFASVAAGAVVFAGMVAWGRDRPDRLERVAVALVSTGAVGALYLGLQRVGWDWVDWANEPRQPAGPRGGLLGNADFSGAHLAIVAPIALLMATRRPAGRRRQLLCAVVAALALGVWWTGSRGALLALVAGIAVAAAVTPDLVPKAIRWPAVAAMVAGLALVAIAIAGEALPSNVELGRPRVLQVNSIVDRRDLWTAGIHMAADHPATGVGPDAFGVVLPYRALPASADQPPIHAQEAHNVLIDRAATSGLPALGAYVWLLGLIGLSTWRARTTVAPERRWVLGGAAGAAAAYLVQGLTSMDVAPLSFLGWASVGVVTAVTLPARSEGPSTPRRSTLGGAALDAVGAVLVAATLGVALAAGAVAIRPVRADISAREGNLHAAIDRWEAEPVHWIRLGDRLAGSVGAAPAPGDRKTRRQLDRALAAYGQALERRPGDDLIHRGQARVHVQLARTRATSAGRVAELGRALRIYRRLADRLPHDPDLHIEVGDVLVLQAQLVEPASERRAVRAEAAAEYGRTVAETADSSVRALSGLVRIAIIEGKLGEATRLVERGEQLDPTNPTVRGLRVRVDALVAAGS